MKFIMLKTCSLLLLLLAVSAVRAQGNCPPGYYEEGGQGTSGCNPIPGYDQQPAQQRAFQPPTFQWANRWGAFATYPDGGVLGVSADMLTKDMAERMAMKDCKTKGGADCKIEQTYENECAAFTVSDSGHNSTAAASTEEAAKEGMDICTKAGASRCRTYYTGCSLPVQY